MRRQKRVTPLAVCLLCAMLLPCAVVQVQAAEKEYTNSIGMEFVLIPAGIFMQGCDKNVEDCYDWETPQRKITISKPFYLGKYEVTQAEWTAVMGSNPSKLKGLSNPVEQVSWDDVQAFIRKLNAKQGHTKYRLPTEAEWEYAARAGTTTAYSFGNNAAQLGQYAWYGGNSGDRTHPVGQKQPNAWGLYDMHGNVWEWTQDWYYDEYYAKSTRTTDPQGADSGFYRVLRGGSWLNTAGDCRSAGRFSDSADYRFYNIGFRLALSLE